MKEYSEWLSHWAISVRIAESSLADGYLYRFGQFALDSRKRTLSRADSPISLTPKAFDVLLFLVKTPTAWSPRRNCCKPCGATPSWKRGI